MKSRYIKGVIAVMLCSTVHAFCVDIDKPPLGRWLSSRNFLKNCTPPPDIQLEPADSELESIHWALVVPNENKQSVGTPPAPPPPSPASPTTPTSWADLQETLITSPYYTSYTYNSYQTYCLGNQSIPLFVANLQAIEAAGSSKAVILQQQLAFVSSTWLTWSVWMNSCEMDTMSVWHPRRYPLIYKFLLNRSTQTTPRTSWFGWCPFS